MKTTKTNAMRQLDAAGIAYEIRAYEFDDDHPTGLHSEELNDELRERMFKTLVTLGERQGPVVFVIPVSEELDLKKCAVAAGDKRIEMAPMKDVLGLTGYIRGGCSPVGMKKKYPVIFDETALLYDKIWVSAGQRGMQMLVDTEALIAFVAGRWADVTKAR
ncbi:MAG: Cys-tRNA(Pro) deacylase [Oscillospiraceae bacterium]